MKLKKIFCQFPNPLALRVSGMGGYTSKCEKKSKSLHPNVEALRGLIEPERVNTESESVCNVHENACRGRQSACRGFQSVCKGRESEYMRPWDFL